MKSGPDVRLRRRVGAMLREARRGAEMKQIEVEELLGIKQAYLSEIERGQANVTIETLRSIAGVYGLGPVISLEPLDRIMVPRKKTKEPAPE